MTTQTQTQKSNNWRLMACEGKDGFETYEIAVKVVKRRRWGGKSKIQPYRCPFCRQWHIGSR